MRMRMAGPLGTIARTNLPLMIAFHDYARQRCVCLPNMRRRSMLHLTEAKPVPLDAGLGEEHSHEQCGHYDRCYRRYRHRDAQQAMEAERLGHADARRDHGV